MKLGARARAQLCEMRRELIRRLDRSVTGENVALLGSIQACIAAIDCTYPGENGEIEVRGLNGDRDGQ
jgi:hypothetical protein